MHRPAFPHRAVICTGQYPPMELLEPLIERTDNHWYWLGEFVEDWDERGAMFPWQPPSERAGLYSVPKLLWMYTHPAFQGQRFTIENMCGLFTCINPAHWRRRGGIELPASIVLPEDGEYVPVKSLTGKLYDRVHIALVDARTTACAKRTVFKNRIHVPANTPITCTGCIEHWVKRGKPYTEPT